MVEVAVTMEGLILPSGGTGVLARQHIKVGHWVVPDWTCMLLEAIQGLSLGLRRLGQWRVRYQPDCEIRGPSEPVVFIPASR